MERTAVHVRVRGDTRSHPESRVSFDVRPDGAEENNSVRKPYQHSVRLTAEDEALLAGRSFSEVVRAGLRHQCADESGITVDRLTWALEERGARFFGPFRGKDTRPSETEAEIVYRMARGGLSA
jgi:hypothetical protein